jgi:hypothetical protein
VRFQIDSPTSPKALGVCGDERPLGLAFRDMRFAPLERHTAEPE